MQLASIDLVWHFAYIYRALRAYAPIQSKVVRTAL
jgi:hypothetical protein